MKKIVVIGPESTGKSSIAAKLAAHYQVEWVPEYARAYIEKLHRPYNYDDLLEIAKGQIALEEEKAKAGGPFLICDTDLIVCKVWSRHAFDKVHEWTLQQIEQRHYDLYLLMNIDLPWQPDPQREHPQLREYFKDIYRKELQLYQKRYVEISGVGEERLERAVKVVEQLV